MEDEGDYYSSEEEDENIEEVEGTDKDSKKCQGWGTIIHIKS